MGDKIRLIVKFAVVNSLDDGTCFLGFKDLLGNLSEAFEVVASFKHPDVVQPRQALNVPCGQATD
jgi:hypothetical protein